MLIAHNEENAHVPVSLIGPLLFGPHSAVLLLLPCLLLSNSVCFCRGSWVVVRGSKGGKALRAPAIKGGGKGARSYHLLRKCTL